MSWYFLGYDMYTESCNKKPVIGRKEIGTAVNIAVLLDPPTRTNEYMIDFLSHTTGIVIPSSATRVSSLEPGVPIHSRCYLTKFR